ncbi:hypothetical protein CHLRE_22g753647v5 [Chlamydomonas reinhardtii]|uniref:Uncharacterized protein n=1 Tax=Chlamydomonas reinhardtii TaxID=3055 RepID=A0A2K3CN74_CHLRE|nr:uncharacterized protein CHLRE_22g753647v5 [Chlamydomonas reinhardtii]PNW69731.1 hypothetical protein CHLRE_22g753647v5 [Chlamydomonas reinhardtii]
MLTSRRRRRLTLESHCLTQRQSRMLKIRHPNSHPRRTTPPPPQNHNAGLDLPPPRRR